MYDRKEVIKSFYAAKNRCYDINHDAYKYYGGRGIKICNEWINNYDAFVDWALNNGFKPGLTLDRINPNEDYSPGNCRWQTMEEQANNRRNNLNFEHNGKVLTIPQISRLCGLPIMCLRKRVLDQGLTISEAIAKGPYSVTNKRGKN
jgi:hypothetical protein